MSGPSVTLARRNGWRMMQPGTWMHPQLGVVRRQGRRWVWACGARHEVCDTFGGAVKTALGRVPS